jgi:hypothetical protein
MQKFKPHGTEAFHEPDFSFGAFGGGSSEGANFGNWLVSLAKHHRRSTFHKPRVMGKTLFCLSQIGRNHTNLTYSGSKKVNSQKKVDMFMDNLFVEKSLGFTIDFADRFQGWGRI